MALRVVYQQVHLSFAFRYVFSPLYCINNQHDLKVLHDETWFLTLLKDGSRVPDEGSSPNDQQSTMYSSYGPMSNKNKTKTKLTPAEL